MPRNALCIFRYEFVKLHSLTVKGRKIVLYSIRGRAHGSPVFREMIKGVPGSTRCVMLDARYNVHKNYKMICNAGRRPVICTCKNHAVRNSVQGQRRSSDRKRILKSLKRRTTWHGRVCVLIAQVQVYCQVVRTKKLATQRLRPLRARASATTCRRSGIT